MTLSFPQSLGDQFQQKSFNVNKELKEICASKNIRFIEHGNIHPRNHLNRSKLHFNFHDNTLFLNNICIYIDCWQVFDYCNEKEGNVNAKTNNSHEKNDYVNRNRKDIESSSNNLANCDVSDKIILKILIVKIRNSVLTTSLQIRQILIK